MNEPTAGHSSSTTTAFRVLGEIGGYRIERELRRGGMGVVYLARAKADDDALVALKIALDDDPNTTARFTEEIRATRSVAHPGIVSIRSDGEHQGRRWYAMDFVGAANLADVIGVRRTSGSADLAGLVAQATSGGADMAPPDERQGLPLAAAVAIMRQVAITVAHAHARGVLHRDLKPANILLTNHGDPVLADFGVARDLGRDLHLTAVDEVVGTLTYIAPEQWAGREIDQRADIYALGAMGYECLVGRPPERRSHGCEALWFPVEVPHELRRVVRAALEPDPNHRIASADHLVAALDRFQRGERVAVGGRRPLRFGVWWLNQHPYLVAVLVAGILLGTVTGLVAREIAARQEVAWRSPEVAATLSDIAPQLSAQDGAEADLRGEGWQVLEGKWHAVAGGIEADPSYDYSGHYVVGHPVPAVQGLRVRVRARSAAENPAEISLFMGATDHWFDGYTFQLGAYDNSCMLLQRGRRILWVGEGTVAPGTDYELVLERVGDRIRAVVNGRVVVEVEDLLPVDGHTGGFFTYRESAEAWDTRMPVFKSVAIEQADLPDLVPVDRVVVTLGMAAERSRDEARASMALEAIRVADDLLERMAPDDQRRGRVLLRRGRLAVLRDTGDPVLLPQLEAQAGVLAGLADYHRVRMNGFSLRADPERLTRFIDDSFAQLDRPDERVRFAFWLGSWAESSQAKVVLDSLTRHLPSDQLPWQVLAYRLVDRHLRLAPDLDWADPYLAVIADGPSSWWSISARENLYARQVARVVTTAGDSEVIEATLNEVIDVSGIMMVYAGAWEAVFDPELELPPVFRRQVDEQQARLLRWWSIEPVPLLGQTWQPTDPEQAATEQGDAPEMIASADPEPQLDQIEAWLAGALVPRAVEPLRMAQRGMARDVQTYAQRFPVTADLLAYSESQRDLFKQVAATRLLAAQILAWPDHPMLRQLGEAFLGRWNPAHPELMVALSVSWGEPIYGWQPHADPLIWQTLTWLQRGDQQPLVDLPPLDSGLGPLLHLAVAMADRRAGRLALAAQRLDAVATTADYAMAGAVALGIRRRWQP